MEHIEQCSRCRRTIGFSPLWEVIDGAWVCEGCLTLNEEQAIDDDAFELVEAAENDQAFEEIARADRADRVINLVMIVVEANESTTAEERDHIVDSLTAWAAADPSVLDSALAIVEGMYEKGKASAEAVRTLVEARSRL